MGTHGYPALFQYKAGTQLYIDGNNPFHNCRRMYMGNNDSYGG